MANKVSCKKRRESMRVVKGICFLAIGILLCACSGKSFSKPEAERWLADPANGYYLEREYEGALWKCQYVPFTHLVKVVEQEENLSGLSKEGAGQPYVQFRLTLPADIFKGFTPFEKEQIVYDSFYLKSSEGKYQVDAVHFISGYELRGEDLILIHFHTDLSEVRFFSLGFQETGEVFEYQSHLINNYKF